jgi:23S rRNA-/tRNA-specific pseudouridylate synthase
MAGAVRVDGRVLRRPGRPLAEGQEIIAIIDRRRLGPAGVDQATATEISERDVLWEDEWLIAVAKPAGLPFHPTADSARPSLTAAVKRLVGRRAGQRREPYLGVHQRLDVGTSGVALFVLRREANAGLARAFSEGGVSKTYHALTAAGDEPQRTAWRIDLALAPRGTGHAWRPRAEDCRLARTCVFCGSCTGRFSWRPGRTRDVSIRSVPT